MAREVRRPRLPRPNPAYGAGAFTDGKEKLRGHFLKGEKKRRDQLLSRLPLSTCCCLWRGHRGWDNKNVLACRNPCRSPACPAVCYRHPGVQRLLPIGPQGLQEPEAHPGWLQALPWGFPSLFPFWRFFCMAAERAFSGCPGMTPELGGPCHETPWSTPRTAGLSSVSPTVSPNTRFGTWLLLGCLSAQLGLHVGRREGDFPVLSQPKSRSFPSLQSAAGPKGPILVLELFLHGHGQVPSLLWASVSLFIQLTAMTRASSHSESFPASVLSV